MDALSAIGLVSNIVQLVDFSSRIIHGAYEIYVSSTGATEENHSLEATIKEMKNFSVKLAQKDALKSGEERAVGRLADECRILSTQILELLEKVKPKDVSSKRQSLWAALKNKYHEKEKIELERRLDGCRSQLELQLGFLTRFVFTIFSSFSL